jgi:replicative DNA helicase
MQFDEPPPIDDERAPPRRFDGPPQDAMPISRVPPQDLEAERAVLGSILLSNEAAFTAIEELTHEDFYKPAHQIVMRTMKELLDKSEPIDTITLSNRLKGSNELEAVGGLGALVSLAAAVPTAANVKYYAEIVKKKSTLRKLIGAATTIVAGAFDAQDPDGVVDEAERAIFEVSQSKARKGLTAVKDIVGVAFERIEKLAEQRSQLTGVSTGIHELDNMTAGLQPSDLIIVAGRPSMGKTSFAVGMGQHAAIHHTVTTAVFSLEMAKEQLVTRMLSSEGRIESTRMRTGFLNEEDWPKLARAAGKLAESPLFIDDTGAITVLEVRAKCRRLHAEKNLGLVIIDYLQLMKGSANVQSREQEISEISRGLKALAKELNVPVVALSQLNRSLEQRQDKRPVLSDLRESGAIEQDADVIMFVYRDEVYNPETAERGVAEIIIGKQRNGPIGTARSKFFHEFTRFESLAAEDRVPGGGGGGGW